MRVANSAVTQLIAYSDELRGKGEPDRADEVLAEAALARPAEAPDLLTALRGTMRARRADRVAERLCVAPVDQRAAVARALLDARAEPDAGVLLDSICAEDDDVVVRALVVFELPSPTDALCARLLARSSERYALVLQRLFREGLMEAGDRAAGALAVRQPLQAVGLAVAFARDGQRRVSKALIDNVVDGVAPHVIAEILGRLTADADSLREIDTLFCSALLQRPDPLAVFEALRPAGGETLAGRFLDLVAENAPAPTLALLLDGLLAAGAQPEADRIAGRAATRTDLVELCASLHRSGRHRLAYLITERA